MPDGPIPECALQEGTYCEGYMCVSLSVFEMEVCNQMRLSLELDWI